MAKREEDIESQLSGDNNEQAERTFNWFKRIKKGVNTKSTDRKEMPEGLWVKCPECKYTCTSQELHEAYYVCPKCDYHHRIGSAEYYEILFDDNNYNELFANIISKDFLQFTDLKPYKKRLEEFWKRSPHLHDSMQVAVGKVNGESLVLACMDFEFIGGSLGSVMGEKFARAVDYCIEHRLPYMIICKSGGARMMESAFSLMQLAKTSGKLNQLSEAGLPYIAMSTDPSFGGITASFGMLGDLNIAEPKALIGFAGPRVIKETIKKDLPEGFQRSEFILEHGFLDFIVHRKELKNKISTVLNLFQS